MVRRLKEYHARNVEDSGSTVKDFFTGAIGYQNVLVVDAMSEDKDQLLKMKEIIEQKGKPCCINMISDKDKKFLADLDKTKRREARAKAREAAAAELLANPPTDSQAEAEEPNPDLADSEEEVDEVTLMIQKEEAENAEIQKQADAKAKTEAHEKEVAAAREIRDAKKIEKLREQERDLLDQRSQPIRQYLMDNVVPHLTEGLIDLCKTIPEDPVDYLSNFLLKKADEIDERIIKERE